MTAGPLIAFVAKRLVAALLVLLIVSAVMFSFIHLAPGGAEETIGGRFATPAQLESIRERYGLNDSLPAQYGRFLSGVVQLDFGNSLITRQPVVDAIGGRLKVSGPLVIISFLLICLIGGFLGTFAALRKGTGLDRFLVGTSIAGASSPAFATAILLIFVFGVQLAWFPTFGEGEGFASRAEHLVLPVATLTLVGVAAMMKITRARVIQVLDEDYVTFVRARGLSPRRIMTHTVLRNAGVQLVTQSGVILLGLISGGILVEVTFVLDGVGTLFIESVSARDIPLIQGITLLITAFIVTVNLFVDIMYFFLDPRVRATATGLGRG